MKRKTTTEVVTKSLARSGPEIQPNQIRLADEAQTDKDKVFTQTDVNQGMSGGGGGGSDPSLPYELVLGETDSNDLVSKRQSAEDGIAPAQILETITLKDSKGANLGGIYFESSGGIGVALSHRYENTILIQGGALENKITALEARVAELENKAASNA